MKNRKIKNKKIAILKVEHSKFGARPSYVQIFYIHMEFCYWNYRIFTVIIRQKQLNFFVVWALGGINSGRSVDKTIIITQSLKVGTSKNINIDQRGKETCAFKSDHISLLHDSTISNTLKFCFLLFHYNPKKKIILEEK